MAQHTEPGPANLPIADNPRNDERSVWRALQSGQQRLIAAGSVIAIGGLVFLFSAAYRSNTQFVQWNARVIHTRDVLRALEGFSSAVKSGQLAAVDYYTNGTPGGPKAFDASRSAAHQALVHVRSLTSDNPAQQHNLNMLIPLADQGFGLLARVIALRQEGKSGEDALKPVNEDAKKLTPALTAALAAMISEENGLLETRTDEAASSAKRARISQLVGGGFAIAVIVAVFILIIRENLRRTATEGRLKHTNALLRATNRELEAFSYSVSHDLRSPLRGIDGFSQALLEDHAAQLDDAGKRLLDRVRAAVQRMGLLIDDLLNLSRLTRTELERRNIDLSQLARAIADELHGPQAGRAVEFSILPGLQANGDPRLVRVVLQNLLANSYKFTSKRADARIEFGRTNENGKSAFFVRDNGAGFDPEYSGRLFGAFQRLHTASEFPGTGIGLATVQRIIHLHGGDIWATGELGRGATFFFTL